VSAATWIFMTELQNRFAEHPFFIGMKPAHVAIVLDGARELEFQADELICREGEPAEQLFLVQSGKILLEARASGSGRNPVQELNAGDVLGWSWLFPPFQWRFQARVLEPTRMIVCPGGPLLVTAEENHDFGYELMKRIAQVVIQRMQAGRKGGAVRAYSPAAAPTTQEVWDE
jgi:CRP/FNR family cyclic AMP-dependent transcriptional regulator